MKNRQTMSKAKRLAALAIIGSIGGAFDEIKQNANFALSSEKNSAKSRDLAISRSLVKNFYEEVESLKVVGNGTTILTFCNKMCDTLIKNSHGRDKIRGYKAISDAVGNLLIKDLDEQDDSEKLFQAF